MEGPGFGNKFPKHRPTLHTQHSTLNQYVPARNNWRNLHSHAMATLQTLNRLIPFGKPKEYGTAENRLLILRGRHLGRVAPASAAPLAAAPVYDAESRTREAVVMFDQNGKVLRTLNAPGNSFREIALSPKGNRLAYVLESSHEEHTTQLHVYDLRTQRSLPVAREALNVWPAFSRDGNLLAWVRRPDMLGENKESPQQLVFHDVRNGDQHSLELNPGESAFSLRWSPVDNTLAFSITITGLYAGQPMFYRDLGVVSPEMEIARLTTLGDVGRYAWSWSRDGQRMALVRNIATDQGGRSGPAGIWFVDVKTKFTKLIATGEEITRLSIEGLSWHPSGKWLFLSGYDGPDRNLYRLDVSSGKIEHLTTDGRSEHGEFWPTAGRVVYIHNGKEILTCRPDGSHRRQIF